MGPWADVSIRSSRPVSYRAGARFNSAHYLVLGDPSYPSNRLWPAVIGQGPATNATGRHNIGLQRPLTQVHRGIFGG